jgi:tetratricopeptide (TPR) repeat protein
LPQRSRSGVEGSVGFSVGWGRYDEWMSEVSQAEQLNSGTYEVQALAGVLYTARRYDDAVVAARRATEVAPTHAFGFHRLGMALSDARRYDEVITALKTAVKLSRDSGIFGQAATDRAASARDQRILTMTRITEAGIILNASS